MGERSLCYGPVIKADISGGVCVEGGITFLTTPCRVSVFFSWPGCIRM